MRACALSPSSEVTSQPDRVVAGLECELSDAAAHGAEADRRRSCGSPSCRDRRPLRPNGRGPPRRRRAASGYAASSSSQLRGAQTEQVDEIARRPEGIADNVAGHRRERHDDHAVTLGEQHRLPPAPAGRRVAPALERSRVGRASGANGDLAALADLTCESCRQVVGQPEVPAAPRRLVDPRITAGENRADPDEEDEDDQCDFHACMYR